MILSTLWIAALAVTSPAAAPVDPLARELLDLMISDTDHNKLAEKRFEMLFQSLPVKTDEDRKCAAEIKPKLHDVVLGTSSADKIKPLQAAAISERYSHAELVAMREAYDEKGREALGPIAGMKTSVDPEAIDPQYSEKLNTILAKCRPQ